MDVVVNVVTAPTAATLLAGVQLAGVRVSITDASNNPVYDSNGTPIAPVTLANSPYSASFANVPAGSYIAVAAALDSSGASIGSPVQQAFAVTATPASGPVTYDAPQSVSVSVS
ncbi:hypothetical protein BDI4_220005 [Burkholderia diffusa]|uniref:hypothetical protein n=1 Tax=Burkholderia diffusa TaxID=488732 RepID=UPI001CAFC065|nr:hypothetical protein [Burkholderia diffusa]CAG9248535.1 hypothetical protein BDI4_220005 [Burkholderia diffusa]